MEVNGTVRKGCINSILDQGSKIITLGENNSIIKPNLYIDEYLVEARHGASIGKFNKDQIFYLNSRGIDELESHRLLTKGFLFNHLNIENIDNIEF
jgi:Fe-S cluster assembly scaffold protein SufB